jgi:peptidoglycan/LPS O-acetylase OafA/YrhL
MLQPQAFEASTRLAKRSGAAARASAFAYEPVLDGWRAVSILLVLLSHGGLDKAVPGGLGVTIFFFISGFLITSLLISEFRREGRISLKNFYLRRFWRLAPPLICFIILSALLIVVCLKSVKVVELLSGILYFANYYAIYWQYEALPFGPSPLKILWSLAIEEHFYIFFAPLLAFFAHTRRRLFLLLLVLLAVPLAIRCADVLAEPLTLIRYEYTYMATEARIDSIAWGALLAWLCSHVEAARLKALLDNEIAVGASLGLLLVSLLLRDEGFRESIRYSLQGMALLPLFYATVLGRSVQPLRALLASRPAVLIGKLSYSIYLYHWLALVVADGVAGEDRALSLPWLLTYYLLSIGLSYGSYRFIERPSLALRKRYGSHVPG